TRAFVVAAWLLDHYKAPHEIAFVDKFPLSAGRGVQAAASRASERSRVILGALALQKRDRSPQLVESVQSVFDRDPAGEPGARQDSKNLVVVDHAFADLAVPERVLVADRAVARAKVLERRATGEVPIRRVQRHHSRQDFFQKPDRIVAAYDSVGRIVLDAESG